MVKGPEDRLRSRRRSRVEEDEETDLKSSSLWDAAKQAPAKVWGFLKERFSQAFGRRDNHFAYLQNGLRLEKFLKQDGTIQLTLEGEPISLEEWFAVSEGDPTLGFKKRRGLVRFLTERYRRTLLLDTARPRKRQAWLLWGDSGYVASKLSRMCGSLTFASFYPAVVELAKEKLSKQKNVNYAHGLEALRNRLQEDSLDGIVLVDMLSELVDPAAFLESLYPLLKPTGRLVISVPHDRRVLFRRNFWAIFMGRFLGRWQTHLLPIMRFHLWDRKKLAILVRRAYQLHWTSLPFPFTDFFAFARKPEIDEMMIEEKKPTTRRGGRR